MVGYIIIDIVWSGGKGLFIWCTLTLLEDTFNKLFRILCIRGRTIWYAVMYCNIILQLIYREG